MSRSVLARVARSQNASEKSRNVTPCGTERDMNPGVSGLGRLQFLAESVL